MILSDKSIAQQISAGRIGVDPEPRPDQYQPASLDVRIGGEIYNPRHDAYTTYEDTIPVIPGDRLLGTTVETIDLPNDLAADLSGRSTVGREGVIVHFTAGWCDPGWTGQITLELYNFDDDIHEFEVGDRVGQLVFFPLDQPSSGYDGQYDGQEGPTKAGDL